METTINKRSQVLRELEIFVSEEELAKAFDDAYTTIRPQMTLPGFRAGKAPVSLIKKLHGDAIEGDALEKMAQEKFKEVVEVQKLEPIGTPVMTDLHRHHGEGAHFKIAYEVKPEITLAEFDGAEVEQPVFSVTDADVEERVHYLRFNYSSKEPSPQIDDDETIVSLTFTDHSNPEQAKTESTTVYLHDPQIVPELRDALIGKKINDTFDINLPQSVDGEQKTLPVTIAIDTIEKVTLPAVNEEFAKKISRDKAATELEVRMLVREELEANAKRRSQEGLESNMVNILLSKHEFQVPRTFTYTLIDAMLKEAKEENKRRGYPEDYGINEEEFRTNAWGSAETRAKWLMLREKLVEAMNLEASEDEIKALAAKDAEQYGIPADNLEKYYLSSDEIKERVRSEKLVEELKKRFIVKEKEIASNK
ncbi:MAG TPA: trigger factor [Candidatus Kapabacteria bacterium]|nr:trigger factor [Candidatus Kapabacteria bacterium]